MTNVIPKNENINKFIEEFNKKNGIKKNPILDEKTKKESEHSICILCETCSYNKNYKSIMKLHGNKIWFTMHLIVESIPPEKKMTIKECAVIWISLYTIINSLPCCKCTLSSLKWIQKIAPPNNCPNNREDWMKEIWNHHNDVNQDLWLENAVLTTEKKNIYTWKRYMKDVEERHMTCGKLEKDDYLFGKIDDYKPIYKKKELDEDITDSIVNETPDVTMKKVMHLL